MHRARGWLFPAFLLLAYLLPQESAEGWALKVGFLVTALCALAFVSVARSGMQKPSGFIAASLILFSSWALVSLLWSGNVSRHFSQAMMIVLSSVLVISGGAGVSAARACLAVALIAGLEAVRASIPLSGLEIQYLHRISGTFTNASHYAAFLAAAYGITLAYAFRNKGGKSFLLHLCSLMLLGSAALAKSRGLIPMTAAVFVALAAGGVARLRPGHFLAALAAAVLVIISPAGPLERISTQFGGGEPLAFARMEIWATSMRIIQEHAAGGVGLGAYGDAFNAVRPAGLYMMTTDYAHNELIQAACELGMAGLGLAVLALAAMAARFRRRVSFRSDCFPAFAGLSAILVSSLFDFTLHVPVIAFSALLLYVSSAPAQSSSAKPPPRFALAILAAVLAIPAAWSIMNALSQVYYSKGARAFGEGREDEARAYFSVSSRIAPNAEALVAVAAGEKDPGRRTSLLKSAIRLRRGWINPRADLIETYLSEGQIPEASKILRETLLLDPHGLPARVLEIRMDIHAGRIDEASERLAEAFAKWPNNVDLLFEEVRIAQARGDRAKASRILRRILAAYPEARYARVWLNSIEAGELRKGRPDE